MMKRCFAAIFLLVLVLSTMGGCIRGKVQTGQLQYFNFYYYILDPAYRHEYTVNREDECIIFSYQDGYADMDPVYLSFEVSESVLRDLEEFILESELYSWNRWNRHPKNVTDGDGFALKVIYDNCEINAEAYHSMPKDFYEVEKNLELFFQNLILVYS